MQSAIDLESMNLVCASTVSLSLLGLYEPWPLHGWIVLLTSVT